MMTSSTNSVMVKVLTIAVLIIFLLIPLRMITLLISERQERQKEVAEEVSQKWGSSQTVIGPILSIPYRTTHQSEDGSMEEITEQAVFLPEILEYSATITPEIRKRGIFEVALYRGDINLSGEFQSLDFAALGITPESALWEQAMISFTITDTRGLSENIALNWNDQNIVLNPGAGIVVKNNNPIPGMHAKVSLQPSTPSQFRASFPLQGSETLLVAPLGKETIVDLSSSWPSPSFTGRFLPTDSKITNQGFESQWRISYFGRDFPQQWIGNASLNKSMLQAMHSSSFGTDLMIPLDFYHKNERSSKYGILFLVLTFGALFVFEIITRVRIHPLQYLLVGVALSLFYLLLLSLSEQIGFGPAYMTSSIATILLIGCYCHSLLGKSLRSLTIVILLAGIYTYLYFLLQLEELALLLGSLFLFVILAGFMFFTRKIDWYKVKADPKI